MKILACGSRDWTDVMAIERVLASFPRDALLIHGDNGYDQGGKALWGQPDELAVAGADKLAGKVARSLGMKVKVYTPDWKRLRRAAGPARNREQIKEQPDVVVVFHHDVTKGVGTKDMVKVALAAGVKQFVLVSVTGIAKLDAEEVARLLKSA